MCNAVVQGELSERGSLIGCSYCLATETEVQSDAQPERSKEQTLDHIIHTCVTGASGCAGLISCLCVSDWKAQERLLDNSGKLAGFSKWPSITSLSDYTLQTLTRVSPIGSLSLMHKDLMLFS